MNGIPSPSIATSLPDDGDPAGIRKPLAQSGITYGLIYTGEVLGNLSGGVRRGALYEGKLDGFVAVDLEKLAGWQGLSLFANAFQIHRTSGLSDQHFESLISISNIEAEPSTRLSELWLEQKLFNDRFSIRFGQLAADTEFFISDVSEVFINSGWPTILAANLPSGGPNYPLATPGIRLKFDPDPQWTMLAGVFNGDPGDQATVNPHGTNFRLNDPPLIMGELQYRYNRDKDSRGLAGTLRLGGWHHFGQCEVLRFDNPPLSTTKVFRESSGIYGIIDQQIYRPEGGDAESGISIFGRISGTPSDRALVNFYVDGGIIFSGMLAGRPDDKFGASFIYAHMPNSARALDPGMTGLDQPLKNDGLTFDLTYQAQIEPGWTVQPILQYVVRPGGLADPNSAVEGGVLIGARSTIAY